MTTSYYKKLDGVFGWVNGDNKISTTVSQVGVLKFNDVIRPNADVQYGAESISETEFDGKIYDINFTSNGELISYWQLSSYATDEYDINNGTIDSDTIIKSGFVNTSKDYRVSYVDENYVYLTKDYDESSFTGDSEALIFLDESGTQIRKLMTFFRDGRAISDITRQPSDSVFSCKMPADTEKILSVPSGMNIALINSITPYYVNTLGTVVIPSSSDFTLSTGTEYNASVLDVSDVTSMNFISELADNVIQVSFYK